MGYKTEINYILKSSSPAETTELFQALSQDKDSIVTITKSGHRTFILGSPIMIADHDWNIFGMCIIEKSIITSDKTILKSKVITRFTEEESKIVSRLIQDAEKLK